MRPFSKKEGICRTRLMRGSVLILLLFGGFLITGCPNNNSPTAPAHSPQAPTATFTVTFTPVFTSTKTLSPTATPTPTITFTLTYTCTPTQTGTSTSTPTSTPTVTFNWLEVLWSDSPNPSQYGGIEFKLQVDGLPISSAGVTVTGGGVTLDIPIYNYPITYSGSVCADYYLSELALSFTSGATYVFSTTYDGVTAAFTAVAPGSLFEPVTDTTSPYNGAITQVSWGSSTASETGYVNLEETAPVTGTWHTSYFTAGTTSMAVPIGVASTAFGYCTGAPSTYDFFTMIYANYTPPYGSGSVLSFESMIPSESLTLH